MSGPSLDLRSHRPVIEPQRVDELRRRLFGELHERPAIPGYEIEAELGHGAFGRVYRAFDPRFQRQVALKVVPVDSPEARVRIEREAHALARLSHPHVVQVYDKGPAGEHGYFLALEYVDGLDLEKWLAQGSPALPEILGKFLQVAEGLAAAHRAGLVHRDLKPANVIVGLDGRARVLDFGLARATDDWSITNADEPMVRGAAVRHGSNADHQPCDDGPSTAGDGSTVAHVVSGQPPAWPDGDEGCARLEQLARPLTSRGRFVGTPSYAAPEQHFGEADARSDQFSFCVALFEAVYGRRPLPLRRGVDPGTQLRTQAIDFRPGPRRVPRWLVALLRQGLALAPQRRHADMDAIVRELRSRLHTRPARVHAAWMAMAAAMLTACVMVLTGLLDGETESCREQRDARPGEWLAHRDAVEPRLPELAAELDAYADRWHESRLAACNEPEPPQRAAIDACLDASATALGRLASALGTADPAVWEQLRMHPGPRPLAGLVETLPDPARCVTGLEPRAGAASRVAWDRLVEARMALASADLATAVQANEAAVDQARTLGDRPLLLVAEYQQLLVDARRGQPRALVDGLSLLVQALELGERGLAADIAASSLTMRSLGTLRADPSQGSPTPPELVARLAAELAALRAAGAIEQGEAPAVAGWLALAEGHARLVLGDPERAQALYHEARLQLAEAQPAVPHLVALAELNEANAMSARSPALAAAAPLAERALEVRRAALGSSDPQTALELRTLGEILVRLGDIDGGLHRFAEADVLLAALDLPLERLFLRAEVAHAQWLAARRARAQLRQAKLDGSDPGPHRDEHERRRQLALRETLALEDLAEPLLAPTGDPRARAGEQARVWAVAMASYGYHRGCWDRMLAAGERLARVCEHLEGSEPSCAFGQRQRQGLLAQGAAARATTEGCHPLPDAP